MENTTPKLDINDPKVVSNSFNALVATAEQFRGTRADHEMLQASLQVIKSILEKHITAVVPPMTAEDKS